MIKKIDLPPNPRYVGQKLWGHRFASDIYKIIVHQELGEGDTLSVHNYHISKECHLKLGKGAPRIAYHYTIEKDGTTYQVNDPTDITWHTGGENLHGLGIMLCGDFDGDGHVGKSKPTQAQLDALKWTLDFLTAAYKISKADVYGHCDFGKPACPGFAVMDFITKYRGQQ
jgi:N-acetylmuramoyl-L-alanine amidase